MKKLIFAVVAIIALILLIPYLYVNDIVKHAVETKGSQATGTKVTLGSSNISIFSGHGTLKDLQVANPEGFSSEYAFDIKKLDIDVDLHSLLGGGDTVTIRRITMESPEIIYEISPAGNNIYALYNKVRAGGSGAAAENTNSLRPRKKVIIHDLVIAHGKVQMAASIAGYKNAAVLEFPEIHLQNIGENIGGVTAQQLAGIILDAVNKNLLTVSGIPLQGKLENLKGAIQDYSGGK